MRSTNRKQIKDGRKRPLRSQKRVRMAADPSQAARKVEMLGSFWSALNKNCTKLDKIWQKLSKNRAKLVENAIKLVNFGKKWGRGQPGQLHPENYALREIYRSAHLRRRRPDQISGETTACLYATKCIKNIRNGVENIILKYTLQDGQPEALRL